MTKNRENINVLFMMEKENFFIKFLLIDNEKWYILVYIHAQTSNQLIVTN
jgi:hypothetical protein